MINSELDRPSGVVTFEVETFNPQLSAKIAQRLLDLLNRFNLETRQSQAAAERRFTEAGWPRPRGSCWRWKTGSRRSSRSTATSAPHPC